LGWEVREREGEKEEEERVREGWFFLGAVART
jgi:hypothetical protein